MKVTMIDQSSGKQGCPALYTTDRGTYLVQGKRVEDDIDGLVNLAPDEYYVEVPADLIERIAARGER